MFLVTFLVLNTADTPRQLDNNVFPVSYTHLDVYKRQGDTIADYIMADTPLPLFLPYPRFLLKMEISQTAKLLYSLLLDLSLIHI